MRSKLELQLPSRILTAEIAGARGRLFIKDDGLVHAAYGGNKARKAQLLLEGAMASGARRVLTFGAAGSHHVLALARFAPEFGLKVTAILTPQPATEHAVTNLQRALSHGLDARPALSVLDALRSFASTRRAGDYVIPPGGSTPLAATAFVHAIDELSSQIAAGELPEPDWIVVPLGSGATAAGLLGGVTRRAMRTRILAVSVLHNPIAGLWTRLLAGRSLRLLGERAAQLGERLVVDHSQIGEGYGVPSFAGERAGAAARTLGLQLDPTYTEKAFASALALIRAEHALARPNDVVLFWNTLSAAPQPETAEQVRDLPPELARLFAPRAPRAAGYRSR